MTSAARGRTGTYPGYAVPRPRSSNGENDYDRMAQVLVEFAELDDDHPDKARLRNRLVTAYLPVAKHIAHRFAGRGEPQDDLEQIAAIGLINAVNRYDPRRGTDFLLYAVPTITGEVRRYFRDHGWQIRVPRRLKELNVAIGIAASELYQRGGHAPTVRELAEFLGESREGVLAALQAAQAYRGSSLDELLSYDPDGGVVGDTVGDADTGIDGVEYRHTLQPVIAALPERHRRILLLRFFGGLTQSEIAERVGVSQMQVSRLLTRILERLRSAFPDATWVGGSSRTTNPPVDHR